MRIVIKRIFKGTEYTIGKMYVNGDYQCDTLEDTVRPNGEKVYGKTAIPSGIYEVILTISPRFKKMLPLLLNVPGFQGIRIHPGNTAKDTEGCILVGENKVKGQVINSKVTFTKLMARLNRVDKNEKITIEIV